jgi:hypothetical protein
VEPEKAGRLFIKNLVNVSHLHEMISRAERAELSTTALQGTLTDAARVRPRNTALGFNAVCVVQRAEAVFDGPPAPFSITLESSLGASLRSFLFDPTPEGIF